MRKNLICFLAFVLFLPLVAFSQKRIVIVDDETNSPVSYVSVKTDRFTAIADIDGILNLNINQNQRYLFSCIGYNPVEISGTDLANTQSVKMKMLPVELNPIVVTADKALSLLEQYVSNTSKLIPEAPFYINCYENDKILKNDELLLDAKGMLVSKILKKEKPGKGALISTRIQSLSLTADNEYDADKLRKLSYYSPFINRFLLYERKSYDKKLFFYISDSNDSVRIIGYKPNKEYIVKGKQVLTSGKFYIDNVTETIIRIDSEIEPSLLKQVQEIQQSNDEKNVIVDFFNRTIWFKNGLPLSVEEKILYKSKQDTSDSVYANIVIQKYELTDKSNFESKPYKKAKNTAVAYQELKN